MKRELGGSQISALLESVPGIVHVLRSPVADALVGMIRAGAGIEPIRHEHVDELIQYAVRRGLIPNSEGEELLAEVRAAVPARRSRKRAGQAPARRGNKAKTGPPKARTGPFGAKIKPSKDKTKPATAKAGPFGTAKTKPSKAKTKPATAKAGPAKGRPAKKATRGPSAPKSKPVAGKPTVKAKTKATPQKAGKRSARKPSGRR
ncbi:MAG: hypothetical protein OER90_13780 [Gemmatimonadota bacterium]|nr:hypothetical protein [Gemmatimonadota bacterium]